MTGADEPRFFARPKVRLVLARVVVVVGIVMALFAVVTARYGFLFAGIIVIGLGAALGPARIRKGNARRR
jgi:type IV secretory pathway VirB2 component (pilin)